MISGWLAMYRVLVESRIETLRSQVHGLERLSRAIRTIESEARERKARERTI